MADATKNALMWPAGVERTATPIVRRSRVRIRASVADVMSAIDLLGDVTSLPVAEVVLSFEQDARRGQAVDDGAAVWFLWGDAQRCVACDLYADPGNNLFAIAQLIRGCVAEHDRGSTAAVRHALESHTPCPELPPPPDLPASTATGDWSTLLGVSRNASASAITTAFRRHAHEKHPDKGGDRQDWDRLMSAYEQARLAFAKQRAGPDRWEIADPAQEDALWSSLFPDAEPERSLDG